MFEERGEPKEMSAINPKIKDRLMKAVEKHTEVETKAYRLSKRTFNVATAKKGSKFKKLRKDVQKALCSEKSYRPCDDSKASYPDTLEAISLYVSQPRFNKDKDHARVRVVDFGKWVLARTIASGLLPKTIHVYDKPVKSNDKAVE
jgi:hypothetical protein